MKFPLPFISKTILIHIAMFLVLIHSNAIAKSTNTIENLLGDNDSVLVTDITNNNILISVNSNKMLIPASILKLLTSLVAINILGEDFHFQTEFFVDQKSNLKIKGYGDPLLTSEHIPGIVLQLAQQIKKANDIILDDTYFQTPITIPGALKNSIQPYDAPNGSLCINFNTVFFTRGKNGSYISAEPQTPLLPFVLNRISNSSLDNGRIILLEENNEYLLYAGHMFKHFLEKKNITVDGIIRQGVVLTDKDRLVLNYKSTYSIKDVITKMLDYSNNFTANQILIAAGAARYGNPGTLDKGIRAAIEYTKNHLGLHHIKLKEGAGLSKSNRLSAIMMRKILNAFQPYRKLLRQKGRERYKTGTLSGVQTRAGYLETKNDSLISFVVLLNSGRVSMKQIMTWLYSQY